MKYLFKNRLSFDCLNRSGLSLSSRKSRIHFFSVRYGLLSALMLALCSVFMNGTAFASGSGPTLKLIDYQPYLDAGDCATATIAGSGFTRPAGFVPAAVSLHLASDYPFLIQYASVSPAQVKLSFQGKFQTKVNICYQVGMFHVGYAPDIQIAATDNTTGETAYTGNFTLSPLWPSITVQLTDAVLLGNCTTVRIFGHGFIPSDLTTSYASIIALDYTTWSPYPVNPPRVNVLVNGNIAIAASVCGLSHGQHFLLFAEDGASLMDSNFVDVHVL